MKHVGSSLNDLLNETPIYYHHIVLHLINRTIIDKAG